MAQFYLVTLSEDNARELIGSDNQFICKDLKTLKGFLNRVKKI